MECGSCGSDNWDWARTCARCGAPLAHEPETSSGGETHADVLKSLEALQGANESDRPRLLDEAVAVLRRAGSAGCEALLGELEPDIAQGFDAELGQTSYYAATILGGAGEVCLAALTGAMARTSWAHQALGMNGSGEAVDTLIAELRSPSWQRMAAAAKGLERAADPRARGALEACAASPEANSIVEVHQGVQAALRALDKSYAPAFTVATDEEPFEQVKRMAGRVDELTQDEQARAQAIEWWREFVAAMPDLNFEQSKWSADETRGRTLVYLGNIIFALRNPDVSEDARFTSRPCEEARACWEESLKWDPDNSYCRNLLQAVSR